MKKIIIIGGPKTGKTTEATRLHESEKIPVKDTEELIEMPWSEQSEVVAQWIDSDEDLIIEGVAAVRGLRKWMNANPEKSMKDIQVRYLTHPYVETVAGQNAMAKGIGTMWDGIVEELDRRGAWIHIEEKDE